MEPRVWLELQNDDGGVAKEVHQQNRVQKGPSCRVQKNCSVVDPKSEVHAAIALMEGKPGSAPNALAILSRKARVAGRSGPRSINQNQS